MYIHILESYFKAMLKEWYLQAGNRTTSLELYILSIKCTLSLCKAHKRVGSYLTIFTVPCLPEI